MDTTNQYVVFSVADVVSITDKDFQKAPEFSNSISNNYIKKTELNVTG